MNLYMCSKIIIKKQRKINTKFKKRSIFMDRIEFVKGLAMLLKIYFTLFL